MQYIGCFEIEHNNILIGDPMATDLTNRFYQVSALNVARLRIDHVPNGIWYCYHVYDEKQLYPVGLLLSHKRYDTSELCMDTIRENWIYDGKVCCSFGRMVCAMDNMYFERPEYAYTLYDDNIVYEIDELMDWCKENLPSDRNKYVILSILQEKADEKYIEAAEIGPLLTDCIPMVQNSSLWSVDCKMHCENRMMSAGTIKGGAVSKSHIDFSDVYTSPESDAVYITIDNGEPCFFQKTAYNPRKALFKVV